MALTIRMASAGDIAQMAQLIAAKRVMLEGFEPVMWRPSEIAQQLTPNFFAHQLALPQVIARVAEDGGRLLGFIVGVLQDAPPVYSPGGKTLMIDDFAVVEGGEGDAAASALLDAAMSEARARGAVQMISVAAAKDARASRWFEEKKLHVATQWWTRTLTH